RRHRPADARRVLAIDLRDRVAAVLRVGIDLDVPAEDLRVELASCGGAGRSEVHPGRLVQDPGRSLNHLAHLHGQNARRPDAVAGPWILSLQASAGDSGP